MRRNQAIIIYVLCLVPFVFLSFPQAGQTAERLYLTFLLPVVKIIDWTSGGAIGLTQRLLYPSGLVDENRKLNQKIDELEMTLIQMTELEDENLRLRSLLDFKRRVTGTTVPAQVVGRDASPWRGSLIVDKGTLDGIGVNMPVVTDLGVVGVVIDAGRRLSRVLLLPDGAFRVSGQVQRTRVEGVLEGNGAQSCEMKYVPQNALIKEGDVVVTSGLGGLFPKGLILGVVSFVDNPRDQLFKEVKVEPTVDFSSLEEVLIVTDLISV